MNELRPTPASPGIGLCRLGPDGDHCIGCLRSREEIARWATTDDVGRNAILAAVADRREQADRARRTSVETPGATAETG